MSFNTTETFFTLFAINVLGMETGRATQLLAVFPLTGLLFTIPGGFLSARLGRRRTVVACLAAIMTMLIGAYFFASVPYIVVMLAVNGVAWALILVNALPMIYDLGAGQSMGTYTGWYFLMTSLASIVAPPLVGQLVDFTGTYRTIYILSPLFILLALIFIARSPKVETQTA